MTTARMLLLLLGILANAAGAQAQAKYQYVVDAANRVSAFLGESPTPSAAALAKASSEMCTTLKRLLEDPLFKDDVYRLSKLATTTRKEQAQIKRDLSVFMGSFMVVEKEALLRAGLTRDAADRLLWSAAALRNDVDQERDPRLIIDDVGALRNEVCQGARAMSDKEAKSHAVTKWAYRFGGVVLIVVDAAASIPAPVAASSGALGAVVTTWGESK
jgi:hypothetical protein